MFNISQYFERIKNLYKKEHTLKQEVMNACREAAHIECAESSIHIREGVARIKLSPLERGHLLIHKEKIVRLVIEKTAGKVHDIQ